MVRSSMNQAAEHDPLPRHPLRAAEGRYARDPASAPALDAVIASRMPNNGGAPQDLLSRLIPRPDAPRSKSPPLNVHPAQLVKSERALASAGRLWICQSSCEHRTGLMRTDPRVDATGAPSPVSRALCFPAQRRKTAALRRKRQRAHGRANETGARM